VRLCDALLEMGVNYFDTAPAYGVSEERLGRLLVERLGPRAKALVISTKVGERFDAGESVYDFSAAAVRDSVARSQELLRRKPLDLVLVHAHADDLAILRDTEVVVVLQELKTHGQIRTIGFSGKTVAAAEAALPWADVLMVEYHMDDLSHAAIIAAAAAANRGVVVKKGLASGRLPAEAAVPFVLRNAGVGSMVIGGLDVSHFAANVAAADHLEART
jgi:aryl-alcohol dehydrogenase-like predicted oxidoreductase